MKIVKKSISKLVPAKYNPRTITDEARARLEASIEKFGLVQPIVWNRRSGNVVGGHQRLAVLQEKGVTEVRVVEVDLDTGIVTAGGNAYMSTRLPLFLQDILNAGGLVAYRRGKQ